MVQVMMCLCPKIRCIENNLNPILLKGLGDFQQEKAFLIR